MTDCSRCGDCCDPVIVVFDPQVWAAERLTAANLSDVGRGNAEFLRDHWTSQSTFTEQLEGQDVTVHRVRCSAFDPDSRLCTAHDSRPQVCSGFPWYGRPDGDKGRRPVADSLSPRCSFNADVPGRTMLPIIEVRHP